MPIENKHDPPTLDEVRASLWKSNARLRQSNMELMNSNVHRFEMLVDVIRAFKSGSLILLSESIDRIETYLNEDEEPCKTET